MLNLPAHLAHISLKDLLKPPFLPCPSCGGEGLGVMSIGNHQYSRRCYICGITKRYPLPRLQKKVIYLDQFVISNMAKQLSPKPKGARENKHDKFFLELFEVLDRLCKLQLAVCPESALHLHESVVTGHHFEELREVYSHLSYEVRMSRPEQVLHYQIAEAFHAWIDGVSLAWPGERHIALDGRLDDWTNWLRIELNYVLPGLSDELVATKNDRTKHLHTVCGHWCQMKAFSFKEVFESELRGFGEITINKYLRHLAKFEKAMHGEISVSEIAFEEPEATLMRNLVSMAQRLPNKDGGPLEVIRSFFASNEFRKVPYVKTWCLFWATLARVARDMNPDHFPSGSLYNDLDMVAAYSPYCDAMFVDNEMENLASQGDLRKCLASGSKIFSLRSKDQFLDYLRGLESSATQEHLALVREVYGPDAGIPYTTLLKRER